MKINLSIKISSVALGNYSLIKLPIIHKGVRGAGRFYSQFCCKQSAYAYSCHYFNSIRISL